MITPDFAVSQDDTCVVVSLQLKYVRISAAEMLVVDNTFSFYLKPYFLRLSFVQSLRDEELDDNVFDHATKKLTVRIRKAVQGEHFKDLDVLSKLFESKPKRTQARPKITVLNESTTDVTEMSDNKLEIIDDRQHNIGLYRDYDDFFDNHQEELYEMADIDPSATAVFDRADALRHVENVKFDPDHYVYNFFEDQPIRDLMRADLVIQVRGKPIRLVQIDKQTKLT